MDICSSTFMVIRTPECSYLRLPLSSPPAPVQTASSFSASKSSAAPRDNSSSQTTVSTKSRPSTGAKAYPPPRKMPRPPPRSPFHMVSKLYLVIVMPFQQTSTNYTWFLPIHLITHLSSSGISCNIHKRNSFLTCTIIGNNNF